MPDHPGLGERNRQERSNGEKWNQAICHSTKDDQKKSRQDRKYNDSLRVNESSASRVKRMRQVIVQSNGPAEPRKVRECRIGGQGKNRQDRTHRNVIKGAFARDSRNKHRQNALISRFARNSSRDAIAANQERDAREQDD